MNNFRMWLANFMRGRYGTDALNKFLLAVALVLIILDLFVSWRFVDVLTVLVLIYVYSRMFSRNISNRYRENQKFLQFISKFRGIGAVNTKTHKVMRCPGCGGKLRVPRGVGTIMINCPHCSTKFQKKV